MRTMVFVGPEALGDDAELEAWVRAAREFAATLPAKRPRSPWSPA
jgi:hypothetical protein